MSKFVLTVSAALSIMVLAATPAAAAIVQNGSFETLAGPFTNTAANYEQLANGSSFITGWTVSSSSGDIVLGQTVTGDGHSAADGTYFVDLSGFGASSPDGALNQTIHTVAGATYAFSMDLGSSNSGTIFASVGGSLLTLTSGAAFSVGSESWTPWSGTFTGGANHNPLLTIGNGTPGSQIDFLDNVSIVQTGGGSGAPEPAGWALMILGFGGVGASMRRRRAVTA